MTAAEKAAAMIPGFPAGEKRAREESESDDAPGPSKIQRGESAAPEVDEAMTSHPSPNPYSSLSAPADPYSATNQSSVPYHPSYLNASAPHPSGVDDMDDPLLHYTEPSSHKPARPS